MFALMGQLLSYCQFYDIFTNKGQLQIICRKISVYHNSSYE